MNLWIYIMTADGQMIETAKSIAMVTTHIFHKDLWDTKDMLTAV